MQPSPARPEEVSGQQLVLPTVSSACQMLLTAGAETHRQLAVRGTAAALAAALRMAATAEVQPPRSGALHSIALGCKVIEQLLEHGCAAHDPLLQPGNPSEWAAVRIAIMRALPRHQQLHVAPALDSVSRALQLATPEGRAALQRQQAAAAAADVAMQELLQVCRPACCGTC